MNPWVAGRIIEQMQEDARDRAHQARIHRAVRAQRHQVATETRVPRRERIGLAVAGLGLRIAGRDAEPAARRGSFASPKLEACR